MPFFNEPDGVYHYAVSSNIVGLTTDITRYGETATWGGPPQNLHELPSIQNGKYFEKYYLTKVALMPINKLPHRPFVNVYPPLLSYYFGGHLLPAIGIWIGYHIYPSIGVMITFGRLLTMLVCSIAMFFIIKYVKKGKLLFATIALSPVILNTFSSLSYDSLSFVLIALLTMLTINIIVDKKITIKTIVEMGIISLAILFWAKPNFILALLAFILAIIYVYKEYFNLNSQTSRIRRSFKRKKGKLSAQLFIFVSLIVVIIGIAIVEMAYGGVGEILYRFFINLSVNFNPQINVNDINSLLVQPLANTNYMPVWLTGVWFILVAVSALVEEKFVESRLVSIGSVIIFVLGIIAVYLGFYKLSFATGRSGIMGYIGGVQGRYITPLLLLLPLIVGNLKFKAKFSSCRLATLFMVVTVLVSGGLLVFDTWFSAIYMGL